MKPDTIITVELSNEEIVVLLALAQLGVKACQGEQFDVATASYVHLRAKLNAAQKAAAEAPPRADNINDGFDMEAAE